MDVVYTKLCSYSRWQCSLSDEAALLFIQSSLSMAQLTFKS